METRGEAYSSREDLWAMAPKEPGIYWAREAHGYWMKAEDLVQVQDRFRRQAGQGPEAEVRVISAAGVKGKQAGLVIRCGDAVALVSVIREKVPEGLEGQAIRAALAIRRRGRAQKYVEDRSLHGMLREALGYIPPRPCL